MSTRTEWMEAKHVRPQVSEHEDAYGNTDTALVLGAFGCSEVTAVTGTPEELWDFARKLTSAVTDFVVEQGYRTCDRCDRIEDASLPSGHDDGRCSICDPSDGPAMVDSPSGWSYRETQENGDEVSCQGCGNALNDDYVIVNDAEGYAYHLYCLDEESA